MSLSYLKPFQVNTSKTQSDQSSKIIFNALSADSSMRSSFNYFLMHRTGNLLTCKSICSFILEISILLENRNEKFSQGNIYVCFCISVLCLFWEVNERRIKWKTDLRLYCVTVRSPYGPRGLFEGRKKVAD